MTQPKFAPILPNVEVRNLHKLPVPPPWRAHRPADFRPRPGAKPVAGRGNAGPDQGYGLLLAERFADRVQLAEGEHLEDVLSGAAVIALRRASMFGRAPVAPDLELALCLFGYLGEAGDDVVQARQALFRGVAHGYWLQRELADLVPEETLRMAPAALMERLGADPAAFYGLSGISSISD